MNDIDFDEYQPKEAECNVYLSMDEKYRDAIRMRAEAIYGDTVYNLFAQIDPASQYRDMQREGALKKCLEAYFDIEERAGEIYGLCTKEDKIYDQGDADPSHPKSQYRNRHVRGFAGSGHSGGRYGFEGDGADTLGIPQTEKVLPSEKR